MPRPRFPMARFSFGRIRRCTALVNEMARCTSVPRLSRFVKPPIVPPQLPRSQGRDHAARIGLPFPGPEFDRVGQETPSAVEQLKAVAEKLAGGEVRLAYKFKPGEVFRTKITHLATVDTKVNGVSQVVKTRSVSGKTWQIEKVDEQGNITFTHTVEWVDLWNKVSDRPEVKYDSRGDQAPPPGYENVTQSIGKPLATITMNPAGQVVSRTDARKTFNPGIGDLAVPLPPKAIKIGGKWHLDEEVKLSDEQRRVKVIQVRHQYVLDKVETGVATISVATQSLTPVDDPKFEAQLVQRMQKGTIRFDIDAGRILRGRWTSMKPCSASAAPIAACSTSPATPRSR